MNEFQVTNLAAETGALLPYLVVACGGLPESSEETLPTSLASIGIMR